MRDPDQIELILTRFLQVRAKGKWAILAAVVCVLWITALAFS